MKSIIAMLGRIIPDIIIEANIHLTRWAICMSTTSGYYPEPDPTLPGIEPSTDGLARHFRWCGQLGPLSLGVHVNVSAKTKTEVGPDPTYSAE
jgi:hypothetical protein